MGLELSSGARGGAELSSNQAASLSSFEGKIRLAGLAWCSFNWLIFMNIIQQQSIEWNSKA